MRIDQFAKPISFMALFFSIGVGVYLLQASPVLAVSEIAVAGNVSSEQRAAVYELLHDDDLLKSAMAEIRGEIEAVGWIERATLSRRWPETLVVSVIPEKPIALWNDDAFLNEQGRVFRSPFVNQTRLPQLYGPEGQEAMVMTQYLELNNMLFKGGQHIEQLTYDKRGNWRFRSNLDIEVFLGKAALMERMQRLLQTIEHIGLERDLEQIKKIDTRYVNGVAVAWHDQDLIAQSVATEILGND